MALFQTLFPILRRYWSGYDTQTPVPSSRDSQARVPSDHDTQTPVLSGRNTQSRVLSDITNLPSRLHPGKSDTHVNRSLRQTSITNFRSVTNAVASPVASPVASTYSVISINNEEWTPDTEELIALLPTIRYEAEKRYKRVSKRYDPRYRDANEIAKEKKKLSEIMTERNYKRYDPQYRDIEEIAPDKKRSAETITEVQNKRWKWRSAEENEQDKKEVAAEVSARWAAKTDEERAPEIARLRRMRVESNTTRWDPQHTSPKKIQKMRDAHSANSKSKWSLRYDAIEERLPSTERQCPADPGAWQAGQKITYSCLFLGCKWKTPTPLSIKHARDTQREHEKTHKKMDKIRAEDAKFPTRVIFHHMTRVQREVFQRYLAEKAGVIE